jgi:hypothetical protein
MLDWQMFLWAETSIHVVNYLKRFPLTDLPLEPGIILTPSAPHLLMVKNMAGIFYHILMPSWIHFGP